MLFIRIASLLGMCCAVSLASGQVEREDGFESLFGGSSLDHWRGYAKEDIGEGWIIEGDTLKIEGPGGDIISKREFGDFDLRFQWKVAAGANSGVMYRVGLGDGAAYFTGPEYQVLDDSKHPDGRNELTSAGSLYGLYAPKNKVLREVGQWNDGRIVVRDNLVQHWLNGERVVEARLQSDEWNNLVAHSKFNQWKQFGKQARGHICLQDHGDVVWYRQIRIKSLDDGDSSR